ncbi:MAG TPA: hypothetical protein VFW21_12435 [Mycobacterium sp.]|nr:hypothetical protein [Mycobacterium sp.]
MVLGAVTIAAAIALLQSHRATVIVASGTSSAPSPSPSETHGQRQLTVGDDRTVTLVNLAGPAADPLLDSVAADIGPAVATVEDFWGKDWTHYILVVATGSADQFAAQAGAAPRTDTAALAVADSVDPTRRVALGQRIVLAPGASQMDADALRIVLTHELFHYAARADTALDAPRWLTEGVADYVGRPAAAERAAAHALGPVTSLPSDAEFTGTPEQLSAAYDKAWLFARYVAEQYGPGMLRALYEQAADADGADTTTAIREVLGATPGAVLFGWQAWLAR